MVVVAVVVWLVFAAVACWLVCDGAVLSLISERSASLLDVKTLFVFDSTESSI